METATSTDSPSFSSSTQNLIQESSTSSPNILPVESVKVDYDILDEFYKQPTGGSLEQMAVSFLVVIILVLIILKAINR